MTDWGEIDRKLTTSSYYTGTEFHEVFRRLRREDPVHWTDGVYGRPWWSVTRYDDVVAVLSDTDTYSSRFGGILPPDPRQIFTIDQHAAGFGSIPTFTDAPRHTQLRPPFNRHFTVPMISKLTEGIRRLAVQIIDEVAPRGECDLVNDIAAQMPTRFVCELMGVPRQDWDLMRYYVSTFMGSTDTEHRIEGLSASQTQLKVQKDLHDYVLALALTRRSQPTDDFTSLIANMTIDGKLWEERDVGWWCWSLIVAGLETTRNAFAVGMHALIGHPEQMRLLRANFSQLNLAVEEILRWGSPSKHKLRVAARDVELGGKLIRKDDWVVAWLVSANRDEHKFNEPNRFDISRDPNPHVSFGTAQGAHFCLGRNLARLEMKLLLEETLKRLPDLQLAGEPSWLESNNASGLKHMRVRFTPSYARVA